MPNLTIKQLPEDLYERLKERAQRERRSLNAEAIVCLERALRGGYIGRERIRATADRVRERNPDLWLTDDVLRAAKDKGRP